MKQSDGTIPPESLPELSDRELWQRSRAIDTAEDDAEHFLDLAGFADGLLDPDDQERIAERLARDPVAAADVRAVRILSAGDGSGEPLPEAVFARAAALVGPESSATANVLPFAPRRLRGVGLPALARWGSLAAAIALASWLGFTMGMDLSGSLALRNRSGDDTGLNELFDPATATRLIRDLTENTRA